MLITRGAFYGLILAMVMIFGAYLWTFVINSHVNSTVAKLGMVSRDQQHTVKKLRAQVAANHRAIGYICSTTSVLDDLVAQQAEQIKENFDNGTYEHLLALGVIKQSNIDQARRTLVQFNRSHKKLTKKSACSEAANQTKGEK